MDLTTVARYKAYSGIGGASEDTILGYLITAVSAQFENHLDRYVESTSRTVYQDVEPGQRVFSLRGYPVSSVTSVHNDIDWDFESSDLLDADDYTVLGDDGLLNVPRYTLAYGPRALKVVYTGGMAADVATFDASYPAIETALWMQIAYSYDRRQFNADTSVSIAGSSTTFHTPELLPEVVGILRPYRRRIVG